MAVESRWLVASLALVAVLAFGALIITVQEADAAYENPPDPRNIYIYSESLGSYTRYPGDQDIRFYVRVRKLRQLSIRVRILGPGGRRRTGNGARFPEFRTGSRRSWSRN